MGFAEDIEKFAEKSKTRPEELRKAATITLFDAVIKDTPVGNPKNWKSPAPAGYVGGRLRANWQITASRPSQGTRDSTTALTEAQVRSKVNAISPFNDMVMTNNLPYAGRVEYDGWAIKAPQGMVRHNIARFKKNVEKELRRLR